MSRGYYAGNGLGALECKGELANGNDTATEELKGKAV